MPKAKVKSKRKSKVSEGEKIGAIEFKPMAIDLAKSMTNEQLGKWMVNVRVAVSILTMSKKELKERMRSEAEKDELLRPGSTWTEIFEMTVEGKKKFDGLAKICDEAARRSMIAMEAIASEIEGKESGARSPRNPAN